MNYTTMTADNFIAENKHLLRSTYRLNYHLMGELGWMNDPNGFIQYKGHYHMFYQYYPYQAYWGPMHWGHAISSDLITWDYLPVALAPNMSYDKDGCFSGSAIERDGKLYLMYTGHLITGPNKDTDYVQVQNIAISEHGVAFEKFAHNPVIGLHEIPSQASKKDFRDPKVIERDGKYYMVLGSNDGNGKGNILLYRSENLMNWSFVSVMAQSPGEMGDNWECPDFFTLGNKDILMFSPQRMAPQGMDYHNLHSTVYMWGQWNSATESFEVESYAPMDYGFDFYAPQSTLDDKGRRIVMAWMDTWETDIPTQQGHHWAGAMTLPREMRLTEEGHVSFAPVQEIENYRGELVELQHIAIENEVELPLEGDSYELEVVFEQLQSKCFGLNLRVGAGEKTVLSYENGVFSMNRDFSGIGPKGIRQTELSLQDDKLAMRIFVDRSSIEVFLQNGEKVMTARIYPGESSLGITAFADGISSLQSLKKWDLVQRGNSYE